MVSRGLQVSSIITRTVVLQRNVLKTLNYFVEILLSL